MNRLITLLFVAVATMFGQQQLTIYQQIVQDNKPCVGSTCTGTILPLPYASVNVRAIGQANHAVSLTLTNAPAHVCVGGVVSMGLEYSFDNSMFTRFGDQIGAININADSQYTTVANAYGAFPYIRLKVRSFDTTNCILTAAYSGVVAGQATISLTSSDVSVVNTPSVIASVASTKYRLGYQTDYDSGILTVPNSTTVLTATTTLVSAFYCNNKTGSPATLTVTDGNNIPYISAFSLSSTAFGSLFWVPPPGMTFASGIKWSSNTASALNCQVVGYQP